MNLILMLPLAKSSWLVLALTPQVGSSLVSAKFYLADLISNTIITADISSWREERERESPNGRLSYQAGH